MIKDTIHFAHANGFPAKTYNKIFSILAEDFEIGFLERQTQHPFSSPPASAKELTISNKPCSLPENSRL